MTTRILIADNNEIASARLTELIQSHEHWDVCGRAENGQKALSKAMKLKPDIIILDSAMPVMDGLAAAREIGKVLPSTPIVLMNAFPTLPSMELEAKKAGIRKVVAKPGTDALFGVIEKLLQRGPQAATEGKIVAATSGPVNVANAVNASSQPSESQTAALGKAHSALKSN